MSAATDTYVLLRAFVDELARCGLRHACTSPGSRSAPLVLSLAREPRLQCHSHVDERCAGFFALGLAKRSGLPAAVACTSGTAVAELAPAVIEAREARVPLLVLSADRPAELRDNGAGQAIDQLKLFGSAAKWFFEVSLDGGAGPQQLRFIRTLACRAYWTALQDRPGAVHLNFPLREPLIVDEQLPADHSGRAGGAPHVRRTAASASSSAAEQELGGLVGEARRGVLIAGRDERRNGLARAAANFAQAAGWPLLADPMSGARRGRGAIAHYDMLLRDARFAAAHEPDLVLRVGDLPVSKPLRGWLAGLGSVEQVALDPEGAWQDPSSSVSRSLALEPAGVLERLAVGPAGGEPTAQRAGRGSGWRSGAAPTSSRRVRWRRCSTGTHSASRRWRRSWGRCCRPRRRCSSPPRCRCATSRASGRSARTRRGCSATAAPTASTAPCPRPSARPRRAAEPVVLLIGDVALAHDIGGLLAARRLGIALTIVLVNNEGGGIFDFLPVAGIPEHELYDAHVATPTGLDFRHAAELYGLHHEPVDDLDGLRAALGAALRARHSSIVEVRTPPRGQRRAAPADLGGRRAGAQPASSGSRACSLISVSASSRAGSESRTIAVAGVAASFGAPQQGAAQGHAQLAVAVGVGPAHRAGVPTPVEALQRRDQRRRQRQRLAADGRGRMHRLGQLTGRRSAPRAGPGSALPGAGCWRSAPVAARARPRPRPRGRAACARSAGPRSRALRGSSRSRSSCSPRWASTAGSALRRVEPASASVLTRWPSRRSSSSGLAATSVASPRPTQKEKQDGNSARSTPNTAAGSYGIGAWTSTSRASTIFSSFPCEASAAACETACS